MSCPKLEKGISLKDFQEFYWLKEELITFCKEHNISSTGSKAEITDRVIIFLETGKNTNQSKTEKQKPLSHFDWNSETLSCETIITDNYRNSENVRAFFKTQIGNHFKFNTLFMNWMKENVGKTLKDAINEWNRIYLLKKDKNYKSEIGSQFEYNTYIRDFLADNPGMTIEDARKHWLLKRKARGSRKYSKDDLTNLETE